METERTRTRPQRAAAPARRRGERRQHARRPDSDPVNRSGVAAVARRLLTQIGQPGLARPPVTVRFWDGSRLDGDRAAGATVVIRDPAALVHMLRAPGQLGLARAWVDGCLDVEGDLEAVLRSRSAFAGINLTAADRARIALTSAHSCAYFERADDTLETAQERKLDLICRKLQLHKGERLLDVGCGWGSLVIHAAQHYAVRAVGVTLSEPQAKLARERVAQAGLDGRVEIRVQDYREIPDGLFDKIASVGMYEHVGRAELGRYARTVAKLLRPGGLFLNHGITRLVPHAPAPDPFISRYVFPDGELHPLGDVVGVLQDARLEVRDVESLREHYGPTLRRWVANLSAHREEAVAEVGPQRERVWRLYMLGSALGFEAGEISVHQVLAARPGAAHGLPLSRDTLLSSPAP
jgi:cyclopropane-fatty-acyl-phospholipid synthase